MKIKKFVAPTIKQALAEIKHELGENAVILNSKKVKHRGVKELLSREVYVREILEQGRKRARSIAQSTMAQVRKKMGLF